jgi:hypothetical protein
MEFKEAQLHCLISTNHHYKVTITNLETKTNHLWNFETTLSKTNCILVAKVLSQIQVFQHSSEEVAKL